MNVVFFLPVEQFLKKCHPDVKRRILKKLKFYASSPDPLEFAEHLVDDKDAPYRYRIGKDWRVKFSVESNTMLIKRIGRRDSIYEH